MSTTLPTTGREPLDVPQLHSADYRNPGQLPRGGRVLVVGAANSGLQIAAELAGTCAVTVAVGSRPLQLPQRILGRDLFFWLTKAGFFTVPSGSRSARRLRARATWSSAPEPARCADAAWSSAPA